VVKRETRAGAVTELMTLLADHQRVLGAENTSLAGVTAPPSACSGEMKPGAGGRETTPQLNLLRSRLSDRGATTDWVEGWRPATAESRAAISELVRAAGPVLVDIESDPATVTEHQQLSDASD